VHVIDPEQIATIAVLLVVAFASTITSAFRDGDRRSNLRLFGLGAQGGFLAVGLYCIGFDYVSSLGFPSPNLLFIGLASLIGFTAKQQDKIGGSIFTSVMNKILGGTIAVLTTLNKKQDDDTK
jgi:hypothetical protein